jgi:nitrogen fixation NifU-like protein
MHSAALLDHFANPRNAGELAPPALRVDVENPVCGDRLRLTARFEVGIVAEARFLAKGCTACVAMGSALTELLPGRSRESLREFRVEEIDEALGGLANESKHVAVLARDAVRALVNAAA